MTGNKAPISVGIGDKQPTAVRFALREAQRTGADLRVVHSTGIPAQVVGFYVDEHMYEDVRRDGQKLLDDARRLVEGEATQVRVEYVLASAPPIEALKSEATGTGMLVIGADDVTWPERLLGGAIAAHLVQHAVCPVVVVPERDYVTASRGGVTLALDGDSGARGPLRFAFEQADSRDVELHVLHAMPPATTPADVEGMRTHVTEVLAGWSARYPTVRVRLSFPIDDAEDACLRATEQSELVVVGRSRSRLPFGLARPLAAKVLKRAHCPVAVVPAAYLA